MTTEILFLILIVSILILAVVVKEMIERPKDGQDPLLELVRLELEERRAKHERD